jgi:hypothetical protein
MLHRDSDTHWPCGTSRRFAVLPLSALLLCGVGCGDKSKREEKVFSERRFMEASMPTKELGEDCVEAGRSACQSGVCIHYLPDPELGYACSQQCTADSQCPRTWHCVSIYPGPGNEFCLPPGTWTPRAAQARR